MKWITFKTIGMLLLLIPAGFLTLFLVGETASGDVSGLSHMLQLLPLLLFGYLAWQKPLWISPILILGSVLFGMFYIIDTRDQFSAVTILLVEVFLFIPVLTSGILLFVSGSKSGNPTHI